MKWLKAFAAVLGLGLQGGILYVAIQVARKAIETQAKVDQVATRMDDLSKGLTALASNIRPPEPIKPVEKIEPGPSIEPIARLAEIRGE